MYVPLHPSLHLNYVCMFVVSNIKKVSRCPTIEGAFGMWTNLPSILGILLPPNSWQNPGLIIPERRPDI